MASYKLSSLVFLLLFGIEISIATRALTTYSQGEYGNPSSYSNGGYNYVGENGVGRYAGGYAPKSYGYEKYKNDYYSGREKYGQGTTSFGYGVSGYDTGKSKENDDEYSEQYGQGYGGGGGKRGGSFNEYNSYTNGCKDGGVNNYPSYGYDEKGGEMSKEYNDNRYGGKSGEMYEYPNYGAGNKGDKSYKEYGGRQGSSAYDGDSGTKP